MNRIHRRWVHALFVASLLCGIGIANAQTESVPADEAKAVRAVVEAQLAAFAADDAKRAFSYAAPSMREMFGTPERFMEMVRTGYPVVYRAGDRDLPQPLRVQGQMFRASSSPTPTATCGSPPTSSSARPTRAGASAAATCSRAPAR